MEELSNRKEREKQRHRYEILNAAEILLAENGYYKTTMEDVAEKAEFSVGTLYNLFAGKDELYQTLIEQRFTIISDEINSLMDEARSCREEVTLFIKGKVVLCQKYRIFAKLYTRERLGDRFSNSNLWTDVVGPLYQQILKRLADVFRLGMDRGLFRNDLDPYDMAIGVDGLTDGFMYEWLMDPDKYNFDSRYEVMVKLVLDGVSKNPVDRNLK